MPDYPLPKFHFSVEFGNGVRANCTEVTGLAITCEPIEYRHGYQPDYTPIKMPGMKKYDNITLKKGTFPGDADFYLWLNSAALNTVERRDVIISLLNENHEPVVVWKIKNAWPTKVTSTDLNSTGNEVAIETLEIAHEGLTMENG
jgi:phage tail-like protein